MLAASFRLATQRLVLRPFTESEADALTDLRFWADDRKRTLPTTIGPRQLKRYRADLSMQADLEEYRLGGYLKDGGDFAVNIEMSPQSLGATHYLSVHTMRQYRGQGLAGEAISAVLPFFKAVDDKAIHGLVHVENRASLRMMEKLGYRSKRVDSDGFHVFILK